MKQTLMTILLASLALGLLAAPATRDQAEQIARFQLDLTDHETYSISDVYELNDGNTLGWVFHLSPTGFIAVPSDTNLPPVMFYSFVNDFSTLDVDQNIGFQMLRYDLQLRHEVVNQIETNETTLRNAEWQAMLSGDHSYFATRSRSVYPSPGSTSTGGWIDATWNQSPSPYNTFCPMDPNTNQRAVVGCVATAMSMILDYHRHIGNATFTDADDYYSGYDPPWIHIDDDHDTYDFLSFPELNAQLDDVRAIYAGSDPIDSDGKAAIGFAAGISVEMNYASDGSGSQTEYVRNALLYKFGYDSAVYRSNNSSFLDYMREDMMMARPTEMGIRQSSTYAGHAINVDGWNSGDDTFHLNMGWGGSNNGWYSLPNGMPSGYDIISGAVMNIEGGAVPYNIVGNVGMESGSPIGTMVTLEGINGTPWNYETMVTTSNGDFSIDAVHEGTYLATATLGNRFWYGQAEVTVNTNNQYIFIDMGNYEHVTGTVSGIASPEGAEIVIYNLDGTVAASGQAEADGSFTLPPLYPGEYTASASLFGSYFDYQEITITADNQVIDFELENLNSNVAFGYAGPAADYFSLSPNLSLTCAIKVSGEDLSGLVDDAFAKVRFKAPVSSNDGQYWAELWKGQRLISDLPLTDIYADQWVEATLPVMAHIEEDAEYYLGYRLISSTGVYAWRDNGPHVAGKGGFFRTGSWVELPATSNYNLCIEAVAVSNNTGMITGHVDLNGGSSPILNTTVKAGNYVARPFTDGHYMLTVVPGTYDVTASLTHYYPDTNTGIVVAQGDQLSDVDFTLEHNGSAVEDDVLPWNGEVVAYPNPFNPSTTFRFSLPQSGPVNFTIYDVRGRKVITLLDESLPAGEHKIEWNGRDEHGNPVASGVYLFQVKDGKITPGGKVILLK